MKNPFSDYSAFDVLQQLATNQEQLSKHVQYLSQHIDALIDAVNTNAEIQESLRDRLDHIENYLQEEDSNE